MVEINSWSVADSSNVDIWPEGQAPSTVNNAGRAMQGLLARFYKDLNASVATTGSANAYVLAANQTLTAYYDGLILGFDANHTNTGAATLNVDSLGAKTIKKHNDQDLAAGDIEQNGKYLVVYDGTNFQLLSLPSVAPAVIGSDNSFSADQSIVSTDAGATEGPGLNLHRNSASPADSDVIGAVRFKGEDDGSNETTYAKINAVIDDVTGGTEDGHIEFATTQAGTLADRFHIGGGLYADGNSDPGAGKIDADDVLISGLSVTRGWTTSSVDLTNGGANDQTAVELVASLPDTVQEIEIHIEGFSTNTANQAAMLQLADDGGYETSGYSGSAGGGGASSSNSSGFLLSDEASQDAANTMISDILLRRWTGNIWGYTSITRISGATDPRHGNGIITLGDDIDSTRITTSGGAATIDGGTAYVRYR